MRTRPVFAIAGMLIGIPALVWLANLTNWKVAAAIFLCMFANNLSQDKSK